MSEIVEVYEFSKDEGTVLVFTGTTEDGVEVRFAVDHRPGRALLDAMYDEQGRETEAYHQGIMVEVEGWQILALGVSMTKFAIVDLSGGASLNLAALTVEEHDRLRRELSQMDRCEHQCAHGPGHQSMSKCLRQGAHDHHRIEAGSGTYEWQDEDEVDHVVKRWKRDKVKGGYLRDCDNCLIAEEPYTIQVYFAPYYG